MGMQGGGPGIQGGYPNQMNSFGMPAMGGVGGCMAPGQGFVGGAGIMCASWICHGSPGAIDSGRRVASWSLGET